MDDPGNELRKQFAAEVIRFVHERVPAERRNGVAWVFALVDVEDQQGPLVVSAWDNAPATALLLFQIAVLVRGGIPVTTQPAPGAS